MLVTHSIKATFTTYAGLLLIALATLMDEILLTRIFSVTMWYHFAFMAISITLFGMTVGAMLVHFKKNSSLTLSALLFALTIILSLFYQLTVPFTPAYSIISALTLISIYLVSAIPFIFSGICICLLLTQYPQQLSRLYCIDLLGAAFGCIAVIIILNFVDAPSAVLITALLASLSAWLFSNTSVASLRRTIIVCSGILLALIISNLTMAHYSQPLIRTLWNKNGIDYPPMYEKWNSFSRIDVYNNPKVFNAPYFWGKSPRFVEDRIYQTMPLTIDAAAETPLIYYQGNLNQVNYLKYDITNFVHYIRHHAKVLIIGVGGGRDVLSALVFKQKSVLGIEVNPNILKVLTQTYGAYTGHLDQDPRVTLINDEGRSYIAQEKNQFDIIQLSLIDTWAATAAGAFTLTENSLYTEQAWSSFLNHLTPQGVLTVTRWYAPHHATELYRLIALANQALKNIGAQNPREHIVVIATYPIKGINSVATILVSRSAFSPQDLAQINQTAHYLQFHILLTPQYAADANLATITSTTQAPTFIQNFPFNITSPTDNNPYFFQTLKLQQLFKPGALAYLDKVSYNVNNSAVLTLFILLITVILLTFVCIILPLILTSDKTLLLNSKMLLLYFSCIGLGFMLIEVSQMQRLIIFLGQPVYSLAVVLFTLLLASGLGSLLCTYMKEKFSSYCLILLLAILILFGMLTPWIINHFAAQSTTLRIAAAFTCLFPIGLLMGTAFPFGMRIAHVQAPQLTAWLWGINGATSVCASVLAVVISLSAGITSAFWTGVVCYLIAAGIYLSLTTR